MKTVSLIAALILVFLTIPVLAFVDLSVNSSSIIFSNNDPIEGENVTINATITNLGDENVSNVEIKFFDGLVEFSNSSINLSSSSSFLLQKSWIAEIGPNNITVIVDPNDLISESNESNNRVNKTFSVEAYHTYYGTTRATIGLGIDTDFLFKLDASACNILVTDTDSIVDFSSLQAIRRRKNIGPALNDFIDVDTVLGMTDFEDSISSLWTLFGVFPFPFFKLFPREVQTFTTFNENITIVPVTNSTNSSLFKTGILWDTSDDTSGFFGQFDTSDQEDLIFVTKINQSQQGKFGNYDYEIKVPALLRDYKSGSSTVDFYIDFDASSC